MRVLIAAALAASLAACATTEETVPITHAPAAATPVAGAESVRVTVNATDARTTNRGRISTKINGYGMEMAAIRSQQEVSDIVRSALQAELRQRGYQLAAGGPTVNAAVESFYNDFNSGMLAGKAQADVRMTVTVGDAAGRETYRSQIAGAASRTVQLASGGNAAKSLQEALADAMKKLFADPAFTAALR